MQRLVTVLALALVVACSSRVTPTNPYDPETPPDQQSKGEIRGTLLLAGAGAAVDVTVSLRQGGKIVRQVATAADGTFLVDAVVPGSYQLEVAPTGFVPVSFPIAVLAGGAVDVGQVSLTAAAASSVIEGTATLAGELDGGGTLVEAVGRAYTAVTNSSGRFHLDVPEGTYTLRFSHRDFVTAAVEGIDVVRGETRTLDPVALAANPATVMGHVDGELAAGGTAPLADATVTLDGTALTGVSNAAGDFALTGVPPGAYVVRVLKAGYGSAAQAVLDLQGGEARTLPDPFSLTLSRGGLAGVVTLADAADASGIVVEVSGTSRAAVTAASGAWAIDGLLTGTYAVAAHRDGYARRDLGTFRVDAGQVTQVTAAALLRAGGTVSVAEGPYVSVRAVHLVAPSGLAGYYKASEDPALPGGWLPIPAGGQLPLTLSDADGNHTVSVVFSADGVTAGTPTSTTVVLDRQKPSSPAITIGDGSGFSRAPGGIVSLSLSALDLPAAAGAAVSGVARMQLSNDAAFSAAETRDYALTATWTLATPGSDGAKTVWVRFLDRAGNASDPASATVVLDRVAPASPALALAGPAPSAAGYTTSNAVVATASASDASASAAHPLLVRLSNTPGFEGATYQPLTAATVAWTLSPGDGQKTVYAQFMDPAGNESLAVPATISLDTTGPSGPAVFLTERDASPTNGFTSVLTVDLALYAGAGPTAAQVSESATFSSGVTTVTMAGLPQPVTTPFTLSGTDGLHAVWVRFQDAAGNWSAAAAARVTVDTTPPPVPAVAVRASLADGRPSSTLAASSMVLVQVSGTGDAVEMAVAQGAACSTPPVAWYPLAASAVLALDPPDGAKTLCVQTRDAAGNVSGRGSPPAPVVLDTTPPVTPAFRDLTTSLTSATSITGTLVVASTDPPPVASPVTYQCTTTLAGAWFDCAGTGSPPAFTFALARNGSNIVGVRARDAAGNVSAGALVSVSQDDTPPLPPNLTEVSTTVDSATVTWQPSSDTDLDHFLVYYGTTVGDLAGTGAAQGPSPLVVPARSGSQSFTLTGLEAGRLLYLSVEAVDHAGNRSGPSGQRIAQPNRVNPRVVATYGARARALTVVRGFNRVYGYLATNQGVLQLDVTSEQTSPLVIGRAFVPNIVPDAEPAVIPCTRPGAGGGAVSGHCVVLAGAPLDGAFLGKTSAERSPSPIVFFPLGSSWQAPSVGTFEGVLPARSHRVLSGQVGTQPVIYSVERDRVAAYDLSIPSFPRTLGTTSVTPLASVLEAALQGASLYVYGTPVAGGAPRLQQVSITTSPAFALAASDLGTLSDGVNVLGAPGGPVPVPTFRAGLHVAFTTPSAGQMTDVKLCRYVPGQATPSGACAVLSTSPNPTYVVATSGNGHVDVVTVDRKYQSYGVVRANADLTLPLGTNPLVSGRGLPTTALLGVYPTVTPSTPEHLFLLCGQPDTSLDTTLERWSVDATSTATSTMPYRDARPTSFVEWEGIVYVARDQGIDVIDLANPLTPVVPQASNRPGVGYARLAVAGRYLYALGSGAAGWVLDTYRITSGGTLALVNTLPVGTSATAMAISGRWLFIAQYGQLLAFDLHDPAAPSAADTYTTASNFSALAALPELWSTMIVAVDATSVNTFFYNGAGFAPNRSAPIDVTAVSVDLSGSLAAIAGRNGTALVDVAYDRQWPSDHALSPAYPLSQSQVHGGYLIGLATAFQPGGPLFVPYAQGGGQDGTSPFSGCSEAAGGTIPNTVLHRDGLFFMSCGDNGLTIFSSAGSRRAREIGRFDISTRWGNSGAALATDGNSTFFAGAGPATWNTDPGLLFTAPDDQNAAGPVRPPSATPNPSGIKQRYPRWMLLQRGLLWSFEGSEIDSQRTLVAYESSDQYWHVRGSIDFAPGEEVTAQPVTDGALVYVPKTGRAAGLGIDVYDIRDTSLLTSAPIASRNLTGDHVSALAVARERLYVGLSASSGPPTIPVLDTSNLASTLATPVPVAAATTTITGLAAAGQWLFYTFEDDTGAVRSWGLRVVRLGPARDGNLATVLGELRSDQPLANPTVAGDTLFVSSNLGIASYDLTPLWRASQMPTLIAAPGDLEALRTGDVRMVVDGPFGYLVGGTYRVFDLR